MLNFIKNIFDTSRIEIKKIIPILRQINELEYEIKQLNDYDLSKKTIEFKNKLNNGAKLNDILPEVFAVVREVSKRVINLRHFDVQILGGIILHQGKIAEMKTGEGKTLVATLPVYLNALENKGVHIVTVNDYLAKRDSEWMGKIYNFLQMEVGLIKHDMSFVDRKKQYVKPIIYGTNNEFGFDYLRDNMAINSSYIVQKDLNFAIVDEVDSILIDEARTPLIISGEAEKPTDLYKMIAKIMPSLNKIKDFIIDEKQKIATLTENGLIKVERI